MPTKRTLARELASARQRVRSLVDERDQAVSDAGSEHFSVKYLAKQLDEAREEIAQLRRALADRPSPPAVPDAWKKERSRLLRDLDLSQRARGALDAVCRELTGINDRLNRQAQDRAVAAEVTR